MGVEFSERMDGRKVSDRRVVRGFLEVEQTQTADSGKWFQVLRCRPRTFAKIDVIDVIRFPVYDRADTRRVGRRNLREEPRE